jgi:hypothetical protein
MHATACRTMLSMLAHWLSMVQLASTEGAVHQCSVISQHAQAHRQQDAHTQALRVDKVASIFSMGGTWPYSSTCR